MQDTIETISADLAKLKERVELLKANPSRILTFPLTIQAPEPRKGERYVGLIITPDFKFFHHTYLLPGDFDPADWKTQTELGVSKGGSLFNRVEGALMCATMPEEFKKEAYWTCEQRDSFYAWCQTFLNGCQSWSFTDLKFRARFVRRSPIQSFINLSGGV